MTKEEYSRRKFLKLAAQTSAMLFSFPIYAKSQNQVRKKESPNFVFFLSDDQGWTGMSVGMHRSRDDAKSDYFLTPNLERLAHQGMRFSQGYSPAALCCPTRRSLQLGQTPARQGDDKRFAANYPPSHDRLSIPRMLKAANPDYVTAHFGKWDHRTELEPKHIGYDESDGNTGNREGNVGSDLSKKEKWTRYTEIDDPKRIFSLTDRANDFMERHTRAGRPFYVQISHYAIHAYMQTRPETLRKHEQRTKGKIHSIPAYAGMTEDLDTGIGKVLDKLEELGISDSTYVFYLADNGAVPWVPPNKENRLANPTTYENLSRNHPLRAGKWTVFEGGIRVPFIVKGPGIRPDSFCDVPVVGWDLLPTLADLAGFKQTLPNYIDGGSFRQLLENSGRGTVTRPSDGLVFHRYSPDYPHTAIRVGDYKLIKFWKSEKLLLFNLKDDIGETHNLVDAVPDKARELHQKLMNYLMSVRSDILELYIALTPTQNGYDQEESQTYAATSQDRPNPLQPEDMHLLRA